MIFNSVQQKCNHSIQLRVLDVRKLLRNRNDVEIVLDSESDVESVYSCNYPDDETEHTTIIDLTSNEYSIGDSVEWWMRSKNRWISCSVSSINKDGSIDICETGGKPIRVLSSQIRHQIPTFTSVQETLLLNSPVSFGGEAIIVPKSPLGRVIPGQHSYSLKSSVCPSPVFSPNRFSVFCGHNTVSVPTSPKTTLRKEDIFTTRLHLKREKQIAELEESLERFVLIGKKKKGQRGVYYKI